jgi:hypothetical protein
MQRDEFMGPAHLMLDAREQMGFAVTRPWRTEQDATSGFLKGNGENVGKHLIGLTVDRLRVCVGCPAEGFEKMLERVFVGHGKVIVRFARMLNGFSAVHKAGGKKIKAVGRPPGLEN